MLESITLSSRRGFFSNVAGILLTPLVGPPKKPCKDLIHRWERYLRVFRIEEKCLKRFYMQDNILKVHPGSWELNRENLWVVFKFGIPIKKKGTHKVFDFYDDEGYQLKPFSFGFPVTVVPGDSLNITYTINFGD